MARGRPKTVDTDAVLDAAVDILWREGVRGVSLNDLADRVGVSKPVLARAFGGKDGLIAKALERYYSRVGIEAEKVLNKPGPAPAVAERYLLSFARMQTGSDTPPGCFLASAAGECSSVPDGPIRDTIDSLGARGLDALRARLAEAGCSSPDDTARFLVGQSFAMSVLARNGADRDVLERFARQAVRAVD